MLLQSLSVVWAESWTGRFVVEFEQDAGSPNPCFFIKHDRQTLPDNPSDIADTNGCSGLASPHDDKRQKLYSYRVKTTTSESISWQWLYATKLPLAYELTLTTDNTSLNSNFSSWLPVKAIMAIGWLLNSYRKPDSLLYNPIKQQAASMLTQGNCLFAFITAMFGSGSDQQQYQPSVSSSQKAPQPITRIAGSLTNPVYSGSGDGKGDPQQHLHTLGLNCFVYPCNGVCQFRSSYDSPEPTEWPLNSIESSCPHLTNGYCFSCIGFDPANKTYSEQHSPLETLNELPDIQRRFDSEQLTETQELMTNHKSKCYVGNRVCNELRVGDYDQPRLCGRVCKNTKALSVHKSRYHTGQKTCDVTLIGADGQPGPCGKFCKNAQVLSDHKRRDHSRRQTCDVTLVGKDGQQWPCGMVCKNARSLTEHKSKCHSGQKTCDKTVVRKDGKQWPCGRVCKNANALSNHKKRVHTGQQTCDVIVVGEDGQQRPCGMICKNAKTLWDHKLKHRKQKPVSLDSNP
ncbi:hypothetical protein [Endozoicomonas sp. 8E]|uniref:hypothetical protein n=1 Tax=Endozoicomonas sp. 8E TaxID=3035692 RepID=UPI002938EB3B|nr:hypothetical protein [Endozoicomonas sp. 8E]WOG27085.1 hypothetical protein P6910_21420 [Endozoicomonas sp. 8E]